MAAAQPALALPTMNKHCESVRSAVAEAKKTWRIPPDDLELARMHVEGARQLLAYAYALLRPHPTLSIQAETTGKAARNLRESIDARAREGRA